MNRHWTTEEFIDAVYGLGPEGDHLAACAECRRQFEAFEARRAQSARSGLPDWDASRLAEQRRAIYARMEARKPLARMAPAFAAAGTLAVALLVMQFGGAPRAADPVPTVATAENGSEDARLFSEIAALEEIVEPRATQTIEALFEP